MNIICRVFQEFTKFPRKTSIFRKIFIFCEFCENGARFPRVEFVDFPENSLNFNKKRTFSEKGCHFCEFCENDVRFAWVELVDFLQAGERGFPHALLFAVPRWAWSLPRMHRYHKSSFLTWGIFCKGNKIRENSFPPKIPWNLFPHFPLFKRFFP